MYRYTYVHKAIFTNIHIYIYTYVHIAISAYYFYEPTYICLHKPVVRAQVADIEIYAILIWTQEEGVYIYIYICVIAHMYHHTDAEYIYTYMS